MVPTSIATVMYLMTVLFACVLGIGVGGPHVLDPTATLGSENGGNRQPTRFDRPGHLGARGIGARQRPWRLESRVALVLTASAASIVVRQLVRLALRS
jgi:hypothetical protein